MGKKSILIIHDSGPELEQLAEFVSAGTDKPDVTLASGEKEAIQALKNRSFDFVISSLILEYFNNLPKKNTHVIVLIRDESREQLESLSGIGIQHYLLPPVNQQTIQNKINTILRKGISRRHPRFNVPGTKVSFHIGMTDFEGEVVNISEGGILCRIEVEGMHDVLLKDNRLTLKFPRELGNKSLKDLNCKFLATRGAETKGYKTILQIVLLLPILQKQQQTILNSALKRAYRIQNPVIRWHKKRLEVNAGKTVYIFDKVHLFRISVVVVLFIGALALLVNLLSEQELKVVWTDGNIYTRSVNDEVWQKTEDRSFPVSRQIKVTGRDSNAAQPGTRAGVDSHAVIRTTESELIILSKEGAFQRFETDGLISYQMTGAVHLHLEPRENGEPYQVDINGLRFSTKSAHLFFHDLTSPSELTVVGGVATIHPNQALFLSLAPSIIPENGKILLDKSYLVHLNSGLITIKTKPEGPVRFFYDTYLPGFVKDREYREIGYAMIEAGDYILIRDSKAYEVRSKRIPLMLHDSLKTEEDDKVLVALHDGELLRLYEMGEVELETYDIRRNPALPPLMIGVNAQELQEAPKAQFNFEGRLRAKVKIKLKRKRFRLKSANAFLAVKGTDFEVTDRKDKTEVLTLTGTVSLSSGPTDEGVLVSKGMMSFVNKGQSPVEPFQIPKDRLTDLLSDSLDSKDELQLSGFNETNPEQIILRPERSVSLFWNTALKSFEIILAGKTYSADVRGDSAEMVIPYKMFKSAKTGSYPITIGVTDIKKRKTSLQGNLTLMPRTETTRFTERILFEKGQSIIRAESLDLFDKIIRRLKSDKSIRAVSIEGHTDSDGSAEYNLELSKARAEAVRQYLIGKGIPGGLLKSEGFGSSKPYQGSTDLVGKARNRRVEFVLTKESDFVY